MLVKVAASGVCHSELSHINGTLPLPAPPAVLGHEGAGIVEEVGADVTGVKLGDHVILSWRALPAVDAPIGPYASLKRLSHLYLLRSVFYTIQRRRLACMDFLEVLGQVRGYPAAHEDDAARAVRVGLEIVTALDHARSQFPQAVHVRIGIHTGLVVVGQMGGGSRHEQLALGETPNIAARVQGKAEPNELVISAATQQLVAGLFETEDRGRHELKGLSFPIALFRVTAEGTARSRFEDSPPLTLSPQRQKQELSLQIALGTAMTIIRRYSVPEVEAAYTRARVLCQQLGDTQDVFPVLFGLWRFYFARADYPLARQLGEEGRAEDECAGIYEVLLSASPGPLSNANG